MNKTDNLYLYYFNIINYHKIIKKFDREQYAVTGADVTILYDYFKFKKKNKSERRSIQN